MKLDSIHLRETFPEDFNDIMQVESQAFGYDKEARLAAGLLADPTAVPRLSLLAFHAGEAVGHILFTRARFAGRTEQPLIHILAPLAVIPRFQRQGIGGLLIGAGLQILKDRGSELVFVLGSPEYYPKHGFRPGAQRLGYRPPYPIPASFAHCWMVQSVGAEGFGAGAGKIRCCDALDSPGHWWDETFDR